MSLNCKDHIVNLFILLITLAVFDPANAATIENRHNKMDCNKCHWSEMTFGSSDGDPKLLDEDTVNLCLTCHEDIIFVHHPIRVQVTGKVAAHLPVGEGNSIACITCHNIHGDNADESLVRSSNIGNYKSKIDICYECHKDDFKEISPHKSEREGLSCLVCHRDTPTIKDTRETVTLVNSSVERICNFCHIINAKEHPLSVDTSKKISEGLPLSKEGKIVCITCHDPHGTIETINFLRKRYVENLELGKYNNPHNVEEYFECVKCHVNVPKIEEYTDCRYEDDFILLCYNCHGADPENCHIVNITMGEDMTLPDGFRLNEDGLITCVTCHSPDCSKENKIRYINYKKLTKGRCNDCHDFEKKYEFVDPHVDGTDIPSSECYICHRRDLEMNDFGMSEKFVCLKCHSYKEHPPNEAQRRAFTKKPEDIKLDKKGNIKCSTCHDPHSTSDENNRIRTLNELTVCEVCHRA